MITKSKRVQLILKKLFVTLERDPSLSFRCKGTTHILKRFYDITSQFVLLFHKLV